MMMINGRLASVKFSAREQVKCRNSNEALELLDIGMPSCPEERFYFCPRGTCLKPLAIDPFLGICLIDCQRRKRDRAVGEHDIDE